MRPYAMGSFSSMVSVGGGKYYEVQEGDSLCTIAGCYNTNWQGGVTC